MSPRQRRIGIVLLLSAVASDRAAATGSSSCAGSERAVAAAEKALDGGDWAQAERHLQPLAAAHADCGRVVLAQARLRAGSGDADEAGRLFDRALTLLPRDALAHAQAASYWLSHGRPAQADYLSALALSLDAACAEALVVQGRILAQRGQPDAARDAFDRAVRLAPESAEAHYQLGSWFYRRLLYTEAAPHFETAAALRPSDARALGHLALSLERLGYADQAEGVYRRALKANDGPFGDPFLDYYYGRFLLKQDRLEESGLHLDRAVALHPEERSVHYERAKLKLARQDYKGAREDAERAKGLHDPSGAVIDLQVYYLLATIYARLGEVDLAREYAELARTTPIPDQAADRPR